MALAGCILRALWHSDYALLASFGSQCHRAECACYIAKSPANLPRSNAVERWLRISLKSLREKKFDSLIQLLCAICSKTNRLRQNARTLNFKLRAFDFQFLRVSDFKLFKCCLIVWPASGCRPQWSLDQRLWSDSVSSSKCPGVFQHGYSYSMVLTQTFKLFRSPAAIANLPTIVSNWNFQLSLIRKLLNDKLRILWDLDSRLLIIASNQVPTGFEVN